MFRQRAENEIVWSFFNLVIFSGRRIVSVQLRMTGQQRENFQAETGSLEFLIHVEAVLRSVRLHCQRLDSSAKFLKHG